MLLAGRHRRAGFAICGISIVVCLLLLFTLSAFSYLVRPCVRWRRLKGGRFSIPSWRAGPTSIHILHSALRKGYSQECLLAVLPAAQGTHTIANKRSSFYSVREPTLISPEV